MCGLEPTGYVVVAADDALPPVVAYALESSYPRGAADNPLRQLVTADLANRLTRLDAVDESVRDAPGSPLAFCHLRTSPI